MYSPIHLLGLPREIRDAIYREYVTVDGGYIYDFQSGKLLQADEKPINLALMLACKLIADEMRGVAFHHNAVTFTTVYLEELRLRAGQFEPLLDTMCSIEVGMMTRARGCITADIADELNIKYPQFVQPLTHLRTGPQISDSVLSNLPNRHRSWGQPPSFVRQFVHHALELASASPGFDDVGPRLRYPGASTDPRAFISVHHDPWKIPSEEDIASFVNVLGPDCLKIEQGIFNPEGLSKWRFSAAAAAIRFLQSLSSTQRNHIRRLLLLEDHDSEAFPECHGQGLILFCQENPLLRIERRVSLWRNVLQADLISRNAEDLLRFSPNSVGAYNITRAVALWMVEARALTSLGMPLGSFVLILDGDPTPEMSTEVWKIVLRDAAWQSAFDEAYSHGLADTSYYFDRQENECYHYEDFPFAVRDMVLGTSPLIACNFDPGQLPDVDKIVDDHQGWTAYEWNDAWVHHEPESFATAPPLPSWEDLLAENVLPRPY